MTEEKLGLWVKLKTASRRLLLSALTYCILFCFLGITYLSCGIFVLLGMGATYIFLGLAFLAMAALISKGIRNV